ncbi:MAG: group 1 truncated hemoglobin [Phycisphaerales bacterium]
MSKMTALCVSASLLVASAGLVGCNNNKSSGGSASAASAGPSVWANLGGEKNVRKVVDDFVGRAAGDPKVNFFRKGVAGYPEWKPSAAEVDLLKQRLVELISSGTGGPLKYTGKSMKDSHRGMRITKAEFMALAGHLDAALVAGGAKPADKTAVMNFAASTLPDIVEVQ